MASENRCPKCGSPTIPLSTPERPGIPFAGSCSLLPKDCRIKELERQLEEAYRALIVRHEDSAITVEDCLRVVEVIEKAYARHSARAQQAEAKKEE